MIKLFSNYLKPFALLVIISCVFTFLQVIAELQLPAIMASIVDVGIYNKDLHYVIIEGLVMLVWALASVAFVVIAALCASRAAMSFGRDIRANLFRTVQRFSIAEFNQIGTSTLITRNTNDVQQIERFTMMLMTMAVMTPTMFIGAVVMAFLTDVEMAGLVFVSIPIIIVLVALFLRIGMPLLRSLQSRIDRINRVMREELQGVRVIRAYNKQDYEQRRFDKANRGLADTYIKVGRLIGALMPLLMLVVNFTIVALYYFGAVQVDAGRLSAGEIMALVQYVTLILMSLMMISMVFALLPRTMAASERINAVLATEPSIVSAEEIACDGAQSVRQGFSTISEYPVPVVSMERVSYSYQAAQHCVLKDITFSLAPATFTALIGPTGSGKTTLVNLIMRFHDVSEGEVLFDGINVKDIPLKNLRHRISNTPQKAMLFTGSVAENLRFAHPGASDEQLWEVLRVAQAEDFIKAQGQGLDFALSQGGENLSGGQRQRLALARGLLRPADLYIFDDTLSALDFKTESLVRKAMRTYLKDRCVLMVTQRVNVALDADQVIMLDESGHLAAIGTHEELYLSNDAYRDLALSQLSEDELEEHAVSTVFDDSNIDNPSFSDTRSRGRGSAHASRKGSSLGEVDE